MISQSFRAQAARTCAAVAAALSGDWCVPLPEAGAVPELITRADGLPLELKHRGNRLIVHPPRLYVRHRGGGADWYGDAPVITVDPARSADSIAADIERRLLPNAERWYADALAWQTAQIIERDAYEATTARFRNLPGIWESNSRDCTFIGHHLTVRLDSAHSATLEFSSIDPDIALALVAAYEDARRRAST